MFTRNAFEEAVTAHLDNEGFRYSKEAANALFLLLTFRHDLDDERAANVLKLVTSSHFVAHLQSSATREDKVPSAVLAALENADKPPEGEEAFFGMAVDPVPFDIARIPKGVGFFTKEPGASDVVLFQNAAPSCWPSLKEALQSAKKEVLITGWDFNPDTKFCEPRAADMTILEILCACVKRDVDVRVLLWSDAIMQATEGAGKGVAKAVQVLVQNGILTRTSTPGKLFSDHQKTVIIDGSVAYIGGLDLARGRWDDGSYHVAPVAAEDVLAQKWRGAVWMDWYSPESGHNLTCARQPWRDIHAKVQGAAALEIRNNFMQRWTALGNGKPFPLIEGVAVGEWKTTIVRSIAKRWIGAEGGDVLDEILLAYLHAIRQAQKFIYIENQFFISYSEGWNDKPDPKYPYKVSNPVAKMLVDQIKARKIYVYVVLPLYPECKSGGPGEAPYNYIVRNQMQTIEFMYRELEAANLKDHLHFFCLGNKQGAFRNMVYVHSKMMIVDDRFIILGSANLNQRSMEGHRDSEICLCAEHPSKVHAFRLDCWKALGAGTRDLYAPDTGKELEVLARWNFDRFSGQNDDDSQMQGFLMTYPLVPGFDHATLPRASGDAVTRGSFAAYNSTMLMHKLYVELSI